MRHCVKLWHYSLLGIFSKCPPSKMVYEVIMACHFHIPFLLPFFSVFFLILSVRTWQSRRSLMISSDAVSRSVQDLVNYQYGICRMYSGENPQDFRLPVPCLYPRERVMLPLCAEAVFKLLVSLLLRTFLKVHPWLPFSYVRRKWKFHISYRISCCHYWQSNGRVDVFIKYTLSAYQYYILIYSDFWEKKL